MSSYHNLSKYSSPEKYHKKHYLKLLPGIISTTLWLSVDIIDPESSHMKNRAGVIANPLMSAVAKPKTCICFD